MNCIEFETAVERAIETRGSLAPAALAHAATCSECRSIWELQQQLDAVIDVWRLGTPPARLVDAVLAELAKPSWEEVSDEVGDLVSVDDHGWRQTDLKPLFVRAPIESAVRRKTRSSGLSMASVGACLFVAVVSIGLYSGKNSIHHPDDLAVAPQQPESHPVVADVSLDVSNTVAEVLSDLQFEYNEMASEVASETTSVAMEMVNAIPQRVAASIIPDIDEIELLPSSSDVTRMWQPIGTRVETALSFLWQAVPSEVPSG